MSPKTGGEGNLIKGLFDKDFGKILADFEKISEMCDQKVDKSCGSQNYVVKINC